MIRRSLNLKSYMFLSFLLFIAFQETEVYTKDFIDITLMFRGIPCTQIMVTDIKLSCKKNSARSYFLKGKREKLSSLWLLHNEYISRAKHKRMKH